MINNGTILQLRTRFMQTFQLITDIENWQQITKEILQVARYIGKVLTFLSKNQGRWLVILNKFLNIKKFPGLDIKTSKQMLTPTTWGQIKSKLRKEQSCMQYTGIYTGVFLKNCFKIAFPNILKQNVVVAAINLNCMVKTVQIHQIISSRTRNTHSGKSQESEFCKVNIYIPVSPHSIR